MCGTVNPSNRQRPRGVSGGCQIEKSMPISKGRAVVKMTRSRVTPRGDVLVTSLSRDWYQLSGAPLSFRPVNII